MTMYFVIIVTTDSDVLQISPHIFVVAYNLGTTDICHRWDGTTICPKCPSKHGLCTVPCSDIQNYATWSNRHLFNGLFSNLDFNEIYDRVAVASAGPNVIICTSLQTDNHSSTSPLILSHTGCSSDAKLTVSKH